MRSPTSSASWPAGSYVRWLVQRPGWRLTPLEVDDLLLYVTLGVVLGGRLGYVLFYRPGSLSQPSARGARGLAGRHVVPRRRARRDRSPCGCSPTCASAPFLEIGDAVVLRDPDRPVPRPHRQLHQWRAVRAGPRDVPWAHGVPAWRAQSRAIRASSTRRRSRASCCSWCWPAFAWRPREPGTAGRLGGIFLIGYGDRALGRRAVPRARRPSRLPVRRRSPWASCCRCRCCVVGPRAGGVELRPAAAREP